MKKLPSSLVIILQALVILTGINTLIFLIWMPQVEGVNAYANSWAEIYLDDPFLAYVYAASILFFIALYQLWKILGAGLSLERVQRVKYCVMGLIASVIGAEVWIALQRGEDDAAGAIAMGLFAVFVFLTMGAGAVLLEKKIVTAKSSP